MTTDPRCWDDLSTENHALRAHLDLARRVISAFAATRLVENFAAEREAWRLLAEWHTAEKLIKMETGQ